MRTCFRIACCIVHKSKGLTDTIVGPSLCTFPSLALIARSRLDNVLVLLVLRSRSVAGFRLDPMLACGRTKALKESKEEAGDIQACPKD